MRLRVLRSLLRLGIDNLHGSAQDHGMRSTDRSYTVQPSITARNIDEATEIALATYPDVMTHVLINPTDTPRVFAVRTKVQRATRPNNCCDGPNGYHLSDCVRVVR